MTADRMMPDRMMPDRMMPDRPGSMTADPTADRPGTLRPGGRTARTRTAVMQAVVAELIDNGYAGTTVERVAARAGIAKTTIYRRWGGLDGLLADLMAERAAHEIPVPDQGNLDADLRALARAIVASQRDPAARAAFTSMVAAAVQNPSARELLARFLAARTAKMTVIIDRATGRGELPPGTDAAAVLRTVTALIYYRLFIAGEQASQAIADSAAVTAAAAARTGQLLPPADGLVSAWSPAAARKPAPPARTTAQTPRRHSPPAARAGRWRPATRAPEGRSAPI